jgi:hypothetical protein
LLAEAGKWEAAYAEFRAAFAWLDHWQIAGGLGDAAFALGKYPEAIEMLGKHLQGATNLSPAERADLEKRLAQSKQKCGILRVEGPAGAEVKVDGVSAGKLPLGKDLYALPGSHTVEVTSPAGTVKRTVDVTAGKDAPVDGNGGGSGAGGGGTGGAGSGGAGGVVTAGPSSTGAPGTTTSGPSASSTAVVPGEDGKPSMAPVIGLGVGAGVALLAGLGVFIASEVKGGEAAQGARDYDKMVTDAAKAGTVIPDQTLKDKQRAVGDLLRTQDSLITGAAVLWIGAAVLGGGAAGVYVYRSGAAKGKEKVGQAFPPRVSVQWAPVVSPASTGLVVRGSF